VSHLDPDQLALLAIGEPVASAEELDHLASCRACANELAAMTRTAQIARSTLADDAIESPPERVWTAIATELSIAPVPDAAGPETSNPEAPGSEAPAPPPARRRTRRIVWVLAASLVLLAGAGLGTWAIAARLAPTSIAEAALDPFPEHPHAMGTADVEESRDGARTLVVTLEGGNVPDEYHEVWLIRNDAGALISLGVLTGERGTFPIPAGVDLREYSLVDISAEPVDGNPAHSGNSIVRGSLTFG
jgi:hypothetical protein